MIVLATDDFIDEAREIISDVMLPLRPRVVNPKN
jgi:hypothetical protein